MPPMVAHASRKPCFVCRGALTVHEEARGGVCSRASCRQALIRRLVSEREAVAETLRRKAAEELRQNVDRLFGKTAALNSLQLLLLPSDSRLATPLPPIRRRQFRNNLVKLLQETVALLQRPAPPPLPETEQPTAPQFSAGPDFACAACSLCRAYCCGAGDTNAYLDTTTLRRYLELRPRARPRDVLRAYLSRLPQTSIPGSCVFHGSAGCSLPRYMRSHLCNTFYCGRLKELVARSPESEARGLLMLATADTEIVRHTIFSTRRDEAKSVQSGANESVGRPHETR